MKTIKELADIGAKAASKFLIDRFDDANPCTVAEANEAFAQAVIDAYCKDDDMLKKRVHELMAIVTNSIEMVNTPGTTAETLAAAINAKIMERDKFHGETIAKYDAAICDVKRLEKMNKNQAEDMRDIANRLGIFDGIGTNEVKAAVTNMKDALTRTRTEYLKQCDETEAVAAKLQAAESRLASLTQRIRDFAGKLCMENQGVFAGRMMRELDIEDKERKEFESYAFNERGLALEKANGQYEDGATVEAWESWQAARKQSK